MNTPKVSIVVPVFNVKSFLPECLDSILNQTLEDIEIICGDGGSNDGSLEIIQEYSQKDPRVKYISKKGSGYGQSVNECMDMAKGEYIGIVESDDAVKPDTYEKLYRLAHMHDLDWIRGDIYFYYSAKPSGEQLERESIIYGGDFYNVVLNPQEDYRPFKSGMRTWSGIYKREFLNKHGIRHSETPGGSYQDVGFYLKTLYYATRVYFLDEAFYMWRQDNAGSSIHYDSAKLVSKSLHEWKLNQEYLDNHPDIGKRAVASYHYRKFFSYLWTIDMAQGEDKNYVKTIAAEEFSNALDNGEIDKYFFEEWEWNRFIEELSQWKEIKNSMKKDSEAIAPSSKKEPISAKKILKSILRPAANFLRKVTFKLMRNVIFTFENDINNLRTRVNETAGDTQWQVRECTAELQQRVDRLEHHINELLQVNQQTLVHLENVLLTKIDQTQTSFLTEELLHTASLELRELNTYSNNIQNVLAEQRASVQNIGELDTEIDAKIKEIMAVITLQNQLFTETRQTVLDYGNLLGAIKSRSEDIHDRVSETSQKTQNQSDVLREIMSRGDEIHDNISEIKHKAEEQSSVLWAVKSRSEDIHDKVSETRQKVTDHGDILWGIKSRSEDIHDKVSETRQKTLDQGDVIWGSKDKLIDIENLIRKNADGQFWNFLYESRREHLENLIGTSPMYDSAFYWNNRYGSVISAQHILSTMFKRLPHGSVVDFGCGTGTWLWVAQILGAQEIYGIDGEYVPRALLMISENDFHPADLNKPIHLERRFDLAISMEVAEHLEESAADTFVNSLCESSDTILFSAAHPNQGGDGHINEQPMEYWEEKFAAHGYVKEEIRGLFANDEKIEHWYRDNIMLLRKSV